MISLADCFHNNGSKMYPNPIKKIWDLENKGSYLWCNNEQSWQKIVDLTLFLFIFENKIALIYEMGYFLGNNAQYCKERMKLKMKSWHVVPRLLCDGSCQQNKSDQAEYAIGVTIIISLGGRDGRNSESAYCKKFKFKIGTFQHLLQQGLSHGLYCCIFLIDACSRFLFSWIIFRSSSPSSPTTTCRQIGIH